MQVWTVAAEDAPLRLDAWLARRGGAGSRRRAATWLERGKISVNGAEVGLADAARRVAAGDRVGVWLDRPGSARPVDPALAGLRDALRIVHEDPAIVVVDKPAGLLVEPRSDGPATEPSVLDLLADAYRRLPRARVYVVHRIDRNTSGLVLFARTPAARDDLKAQFKQRTPERVYQAVLQGALAAESAEWRDELAFDAAADRQRRAHGTDAGAKEAISRVRVLERFGSVATLVEVSLVTGKRNQIRVQAGLRGHPLVGERRYRFGADREPAGLPAFDRQALHAVTLGFRHPQSGRPVSFTSPLPDDLARLLRSLRRL
ncbi:MAG TPA: RluA family pseudouridine synthase [Candidatus Krumholzibacteria bacterium]|nr:RluA family pseudouridine synthase [Candidatus Krumholzibacteria bacterium]HPD72482.1 RluA family pseudouridine synthase [Candidatus Krumholzibacteria bacterium]HRY40586.1 RluA family pseudouridine synthase [Candidatus Krumholzibacteria bacterium]